MCVELIFGVRLHLRHLSTCYDVYATQGGQHTTHHAHLYHCMHNQMVLTINITTTQIWHIT